MGNSDVEKSPKEGKEAKEPKTPSSQEHTSGAVAADWTGFQAYPHMPPHGFITSSPQTHPYMWGVQQFIPPYGTSPHPYVAMYPHGGMYAHPTMAPGSYPFSPFPAMPSPNGIAEASGNTPGNMEVNGKSNEGKEKLPVKRSRGSSASLNVTPGKNAEPARSVCASENGACSKSAGNDSEGSSDGSDTNSQSESPRKSNGRQDSAEPSQNGSAAHSSQNGGSSTPHAIVNQNMGIVPMGVVSGVAGPTTNLNIGMDYWAAAPASAVPAMHGKVPPAPVQGGMLPNESQLWIQDERELKRQRRKQSNRESARRSRLRKQAECDELAQRAEILQEENASLRAELARIRSEYERLLAQNASLKERLSDNQESGDDERYSGQEEDHIQ
ncbi:hypothetical protein ABFS83_05G116300 [Erythranthe nasuta]